MPSRGGPLARMMDRRWGEAEASYHAKILDSLDPDPSAIVLDVGCDDGAWTERLRRRIGVPPNQVFGLELVDERAELARRRGFHVSTGDLEEPWPFPDEAFDIVHANQVIEHVKRLDHFVSEVRRVLAPAGVALVCTENLASWHNVAALALGYQPFSLTNVSNVRPIGNPYALHAGETPERESWQHVHVLTLAGLRDIFAAHGLSVTGSWGTGYYPFPRRLASRLAERDPSHSHFIAVIVRPLPVRRRQSRARSQLAAAALLGLRST
jgi:SAM-dependent methyltransferase